MQDPVEQYSRTAGICERRYRFGAMIMIIKYRLKDLGAFILFQTTLAASNNIMRPLRNQTQMI